MWRGIVPISSYLNLNIWGIRSDKLAWFLREKTRTTMCPSVAFKQLKWLLNKAKKEYVDLVQQIEMEYLVDYY